MGCFGGKILTENKKRWNEIMKTNYKEAKDLIKKQSQVEELKAQMLIDINDGREF